MELMNSITYEVTMIVHIHIVVMWWLASTNTMYDVTQLQKQYQSDKKFSTVNVKKI